MLLIRQIYLADRGYGNIAKGLVVVRIVNTQNLRRTVVAIAWPTVMRTFLNMVVQMVDMVMVGTLGAIPLAAVGLGNQVFFFSVAVVQAFSIGTTALVAQAVGKGDRNTAVRVATQSLSMVLITTTALSVLTVVFSEQIIHGIVYFMPAKESGIIELGSRYLSIVGISISLRFSLLVVNGIFQGAGDSRIPLYLMAGINLLNVLGNYLLIFGVGPFPALGVSGAALATCISGMLGGFIGIVLLFTPFAPLRLDLRLPGALRYSWDILGRVFSIGIPSAIEQVAVNTSQILYSMIVASMGAMAVAAHQIMHNAYIATYLPGIGFSLAATTLVGQLLGAKQNKRAVESGMQTARLALFLMGLAGGVFMLSPRSVSGLFTREAAVVELTVAPLFLLALAQPALAYIVSLTGGLRGAGDTRWAMGLTVVNMLGVRLLLTLLAVRLGLGLTGVWAAMLVESYLRALLITYRFRTKIPRAVSLVHSLTDEPDPASL